jgi:hypothetical protein
MFLEEEFRPFKLVFRPPPVPSDFMKALDAL